LVMAWHDSTTNITAEVGVPPPHTNLGLCSRMKLEFDSLPFIALAALLYRPNDAGNL